jgi:hypothetical protein
MPDIVPCVGRYVEVVTRSGRLFGELIRLSAAMLLVRSTWPTTVASQEVEACEITEIIDLPDPHL